MKIGSFEQTQILGVNVDLISLNELLQYVLSAVRVQGKVVVSNVNVHAINIACELGWFREYLNNSHVVFCDGFGVKWAARFLKGKELVRLTPPDWFGRFADTCAERGASMFFLGARQHVVEKAAENLKAQHPGLNIVGVHHGYFNKSSKSPENKKVLAEINLLRPDVLVVGFGMPAQEKWTLENLDELRVHVVVPVGALFDYLAGEVVRAPRWMTDNGLEWFGRLLIEPRRLWKRYVFGNPRFIGRVLLQKMNVRNYDLSSCDVSVK